MKEILKCKNCGKEFEKGKRTKFCSNKCGAEYNNHSYIKKIKNTVTKICPYCKNEFKTDVGNKKYCCHEHRDLWYKEHYWQPAKYQFDRMCKICGKSFVSEHPSAKYCSEECRSILKGNIKNSRELLKLQLKNRVTLEVSLKVKWIIEKAFKEEKTLNNKSINYYNLVFSHELKERVLKRDDRRCCICKCDTNLEVHHIVPRQWGGAHDERNLITLCEKCHGHVETFNIEYATRKCIKNALRVLQINDVRDDEILTSAEKINELTATLKLVFKKIRELHIPELDEVVEVVDECLDKTI